MFLNSLGFEPDRAMKNLVNFTEIEPKTYPPGRYVMRVKNYQKTTTSITLGFYGTDYIKMKRADRMKYKNFLSEFLKAHGGDIPNVEPVAAQIWSALKKYHCYSFKNNTDITKIIDIQLEKQDSGLKLSKIFGEYSDTVKLTAKPGESVVLYAKDWMLKATYQVTDDEEESQTKDQQQQNLQSKETQQNDVEKFKPQQEKIQQVIAQEESLHDEEEERDAKQEDDKSVHNEVEDSEREKNKGDLEIENF